MSSSKATFRMVSASFAAGAGAMVVLGLVVPVAVKGGLAMRDAVAATIESRAPAVAPLDVDTVQAQLDAAERAVEASRGVMDTEINRLDRLARR